MPDKEVKVSRRYLAPFLSYREKPAGGGQYMPPSGLQVKHGAALFRQSSFHAKVTDASRDLGCNPCHSSAPPTLPNRSAGLFRRGHIRRGGLFRHVAIFNIRSLDYRRQTDPRETETDSSSALCVLLVWRTPSGRRVDGGQRVA